MTQNLYALVALESAAREINISDADLIALLEGSDVDAHGAYGGIGWYVYRHSIEKLKKRLAPSGGPSL